MKKILFILCSVGAMAQNTFPTGAGTNVGIGTTSPSARLEVSSGSSGVSGVKLRDLTSSSGTASANNKALSVDGSGNIILVPSLSSVTTLYSGNGTLSSHRTVTMSGQNLTFNPSTSASQMFLNGTSGFLGLGTTSPTTRLDVVGSVKSRNFWATNPATAATSFGSDIDWYRNGYVLGAGYEMTDALAPGVPRRMINFYDLHAWGSAISTSDDYLVFNIVDRNNKERLFFEAHQAGGVSNGRSAFAIYDKNKAEIFKILDNGSDAPRVQMNRSDSQLIIGASAAYSPGLGHKLVVANGSALVEGNVLTNGNLGIGTSSFADGFDAYRLSVDGAVRAHRVKVYTTWADFVFEDDYDLPSLEEVEKYIAENGHLKDIPSAAKVEAEGIELGEMNKLLLQKVEELTLYLIDMKKELNEVKGKLEQYEEQGK